MNAVEWCDLMLEIKAESPRGYAMLRLCMEQRDIQILADKEDDQEGLQMKIAYLNDCLLAAAQGVAE